MGVLGRFVYGRFHHEPLGLGDEIQWEVPADISIHDCPYYAAQGNASRIFESDAFADKLRGWHVIEIKHFSGLAYVASGGFRGPQLYPTALFPFLNWTDSLFSKIPGLESRMLVVLEKSSLENNNQ
jgi:hypothetical protein